MNRFPGICRDCGAQVPPKGGNFHLVRAGKFEVRCRACIDECNAARKTVLIPYKVWHEQKRKAVAL